MTRMIAFLLPLVFASPQAFADEELLEDIAFTAKCDGTEQRYVRMLPADVKQQNQYDLLIALHGHGSDRWQFAKADRDECKAARDVAAKHEMIYISPDYRATTSWMGPKAEADLVQIIADLKDQYRVRKVYLCGGSMGGTSALSFAAMHPELVDGVAALNGTANLLEYENFQDAIQESYGGKKADVPEEYKKRSAEYWPERFTMPVAMTVGGTDELVPPDSVRRLAAVLTKLQKKVLLIDRPEGGHSTDYSDSTAAIEFVIATSK